MLSAVSYLPLPLVQRRDLCRDMTIELRAGDVQILHLECASGAICTAHWHLSP